MEINDRKPAFARTLPLNRKTTNQNRRVREGTSSLRIAQSYPELPHSGLVQPLVMQYKSQWGRGSPQVSFWELSGVELVCYLVYSGPTHTRWITDIKARTDFQHLSLS
jgi:hypothetical protein